jgi:hypothetical protein
MVGDRGGDAAQRRLDAATMRGLLLDLLVTRDRRGVDDAFEHWLRQRFPRERGTRVETRSPPQGQRLRSSS